MKKFCDENSNVHQPIKAMAVELQETVRKIDSSLVKLHKNTEVVDRELMDLSLIERMRSFRDSMVAGTNFPILTKNTVDAVV